MFVKVKGENGNWYLFDKAEDVKLTTDPITLKQQEDFNRFRKVSMEPVYIVVGEDVSEDGEPILSKTQTVKAVTFNREGETQIVVFNTIAFILNEQGKTVEKVAVDG